MHRNYDQKHALKSVHKKSTYIKRRHPSVLPLRLKSDRNCYIFENSFKKFLFMHKSDERKSYSDMSTSTKS